MSRKVLLLSKRIIRLMFYIGCLFLGIGGLRYYMLYTTSVTHLFRQLNLKKSAPDLSRVNVNCNFTDQNNSKRKSVNEGIHHLSENRNNSFEKKIQDLLSEKSTESKNVSAKLNAENVESSATKNSLDLSLRNPSQNIQTFPSDSSSDQTGHSRSLQISSSYSTNSTDSKRTADKEKTLNLNETEEMFFNRIDMRMNYRKRMAKKSCKKLGINKTNKTLDFWSLDVPIPRPWFFTSEKYRFMYAEIPKSGCSNWKKVLMVLNGLANSTEYIKQGQSHSAKIGTVKYFPAESVKEIYRNSKKLLVVREPMERLASAFLDKVAVKPPTNSSVFSKFSSEIVKKYRESWRDPTIDLPNGKKRITACESREAALSCKNPGEVIKVLDSTFGRKDNTTCGNAIDWEGKRCSSQLSYYITSQLCDGKQKCEIVASQYQFGIVATCSQISKYLTITYECVAIQEMNTAVVCNNDSYGMKCPPGGAISIASAFYGRTNRITCSFGSFMWNTECNVDTATAVLKSQCNHKQACTIHALPSWFETEDPCPATSKYLQVWFTCVASPYLNKRQNSAKSQNLYKEVSSLKHKPRKLLTISDTNETTNTSSIFSIIKTSSTENKKINRLSKTKFKTSIYKPPSYIPRVYDLHATFDEFVSYLLDPANENDHTEDSIDHGSAGMKHTSIRHWQSFHSLSYPCHIEYDFIAHMETIEEDAKYVLKRIEAPQDIHYPEGYSKLGKSSTTSTKVKKLLLSLEQDKLKKLLEKYKTDYEIFGYTVPEYLRHHEL